MAITPRTIFSNPGTATVAVVALLALSALGTLAYQVANHAKSRSSVSYHDPLETSCQSVREVIGADKRAWSENDWLVYARCFEYRNDSTSAVRVATQGLRFYPTSESLFNVAGYHQIRLGQYSEAIHTLKTGLARVGTPTNGVMTNNLAWASLWAPREMKLDRARGLYKMSLRYNPNSCETLHTGLWVEYAIAKQSSGLAEYQALENFELLRRAYKTCQARVEDGKWDTMVEVVGAAVLFQDVDQMIRAPHSHATRQRLNQSGNADMANVSRALRKHYRGSSIDGLCREAMPLAQTHHLCVEQVSRSVTALRQAESNPHSAAQNARTNRRRNCGAYRRHKNNQYQHKLDVIYRHIER